MTNPARELHNMLSPWSSQVKGKSVNVTRGGGNRGTSLEFVRGQVHACWLLGEVNRTINQLTAAGEDVSSFQTFLPSWWSAVVMPQEAWQANSPHDRVLIPAETLATLASFAAYLDKAQLQAFQATSESVQQSRAALDELFDLLNSDALQLSPDGRAYVFALLDEVRTMLEASAGAIGIDLVRRIHELQGFLSTLASDIEFREADSKLAVRLRQIMRRVIPIVVPVAGVAGYMLGLAADTLAITDGISGD